MMATGDGGDMGGMSDDQLDEIVRQAARAHNAPPADVPRDLMWERISAARAAGRGTATPVVSLDVERARRQAAPWRRYGALAAGLAATLGVGVGLGRLTSGAGDRQGAGAPPVVASGRETPSVVATTPVAPDGAGAASGAATEAAGAPSPASREARVSAAGTRVAVNPIVPRPRPTQMMARGDERETSRPATPDERLADASRPYRVAAAAHLMTTEALLVALRSDVAAGRSDSSVARWAGDLLGTTRQLLDSPAGTDPQMQRLLEDLELVLAQIARLPGAGEQKERKAELDLIDEALERRHVLTRMRALDSRT